MAITVTLKTGISTFQWLECFGMSSLDCHDTGEKKVTFWIFYPFSVVIVNVQVGLRV